MQVSLRDTQNFVFAKFFFLSEVNYFTSALLPLVIEKFSLNIFLSFLSTVILNQH